MAVDRKLVGAAIAGTLAGALIAGALVVSGTLSAPSSQADDVDAFLAAYRRSREATFVVEADFTRTMGDGRQLSSAALVVQRPPDEITRQFGSVGGRLQGRWLNCGAGPDGRLACAPGGPVESWDQMVDHEVDVLRGYFTSDPPAYDVRAVDDGCFDLVATSVYPDATYGQRTRMCFDATTGARTTLEVHRDGGSVDRLAATSVRSTVTDADLAVTDDPRFEPSPDAGPSAAGAPGTTTTSSG